MSRPWVKPAAAIALTVLLLSPLYFLKIEKEMVDINVGLKAGRRFLAGESLYRVSDQHYQFKYLPAYALAISPLSLLPAEAARQTVFYMVAAAILVGLYLSYRLVIGDNEARPLVLLGTFLILVKFYGNELVLGQGNAFMALFLLLMVCAMVRGRDRTAGAWLGLSVIIKVYGLIFIPYLLVKRRFAVAAAALAVTAAALLAPALRYGLKGNFVLLSSLKRTLSQSTPGQFASKDNVSVFGLLTRWFGPMSPHVLYGAALIILSVLYVLLLVSAVRRPPTGSTGLLVECGVLLTYIPLFSPLGWDYVFLTSTLAITILVASMRRLSRSQQIFVLINFLLIGATLYDLMGRELYFRFMRSSILTANFVLLALFLLYLRVFRPECLPEGSVPAGGKQTPAPR